MDLNVVSWVINGLMGVAMYLLKSTHASIKEELKENRLEIAKLKEDKMNKLDFKEFKEELWSRLDDMKRDFQRALDKS
jgi:hypothetical protein